MVRCSVALLKMCLGTETVAEGEGSWEAPPPLHPLPVLLTLAGEGRGEKLQCEGAGEREREREREMITIQT